MTDESKLRLAEELVASVGASDDDDAADVALVARRQAEFLAGTAMLVPAEVALRQVRAAQLARATQLGGIKQTERLGLQD